MHGRMWAFQESIPFIAVFLREKPGLLMDFQSLNDTLNAAFVSASQVMVIMEMPTETAANMVEGHLVCDLNTSLASTLWAFFI